MININVNVKSIVSTENIIAGILAHIREKYLKRIVNDSIIVCDEIISVEDIISTNVRNTV